MRHILLTSLAILAAATMWAVPAKRGIRSNVQSDGTVISYELRGDERFHSMVTTDGLTIARDDNGDLCYVSAEGISKIIAHNPALRSTDEKSFISENSGKFTIESIAKSRFAQRGMRKAAAANAPQRASQVPQTGSPRIPILLVGYSDVKFHDGNNANQTFVNFFQTGSKSARQYFIDQSNGQYSPQFDVYGPVYLENTRKYYGADGDNGDDIRVQTMVVEGVQALDDQIDFSIYDNDGDGICDVLIILYAGEGQASSYAYNADDFIWPCQWELSDPYGDYGKSIRVDGIKIDKFAVFNEMHGVTSAYAKPTKIDGIGTFCHEFSHCLSLPDFYDTEYSGKYFGMSEWSLLDYGCYNDDGYTPIGYSAYEKNFMGWLDIPEVTENTFYTMPICNNLSDRNDFAIKVTNSRDNNEYYVIENRARQDWDRYMAADGLLITHVTYNKSAWDKNVVNNYSTQRMTPIPADNNLKLKNGSSDPDNLVGDLWPYKDATELTNESTPAAKVYTGSYMSKPITEMTRNADGTISFWAMRAPLPVLSTPVLNTPSGISSDSFMASWTHAEFEDATYTLEVREHKDVEYSRVFDVDFSTGKTTNWAGWTTGGNGYYNQYDSAEAGFRLGSNKYKGYITSPAFTADDSKFVTVTLDLESYNTDSNVDVKISTVDSTGATVNDETITVDGRQNVDVLLLAYAGSSVKVKVETTATKKRVTIFNITVWNGDATERTSAPRRAVSETGDDLNRTVTGITDLQYQVNVLAPNRAYDYRVKAVAIDPNEYFDSEWSPWQTVTLSAAVGIQDAAVTPTSAPAEYYNLQGIKVEVPTLAPGIYIRRMGQKTDKIVVR